ncbi:MAG: hypothetical protein KDB98_09300, partial [Flavobacteriales bacterium]|nr:hypothetical protein [Flavobacteriales bacterium]
SILTGNDLGQLGMYPEFPAEDEVKAYSELPKVKGLLEEFKRKPDQVERLLHKEAQKLIASGKVDEAWKLLLSNKTI